MTGPEGAGAGVVFGAVAVGDWVVSCANIVPQTIAITMSRRFGADECLLKGINRQAAEQFGIEVGRFLRQHFI